MKDPRITIFAETLLIVCGATFLFMLLTFFSSGYGKTSSKVQQLFALSFGAWILSVVALEIFVILLSWTTLGWWQTWVTLGVTFFIASGIFVIWRTEKSDIKENKIFWFLTLLFVVVLLGWVATASIIIEQTRWNVWLDKF